MVATQAIWLARLLGDLKGEKADTFKLKMDMSALALSKNPVFHEQSKHIDVRYRFIRDCVENGCISTDFVGTKDQLADILMKGLGRFCFHELTTRIEWLRSVPSRHKDQRETYSNFVMKQRYITDHDNSFSTTLGLLAIAFIFFLGSACGICLCLVS
ncbi:hypothetical protein ACQJBY_001364 [Aegilops geniculata]